MSLPLLIFRQNLTASSTRRCFTQLTMFVGSHDGYCLIVTPFWILSRGGKYSCTFSAQSRRISGVLLVIATYDSAVCQSQRSTYMKSGIGGIGTLGGLNRPFHQFAIGNRQRCHVSIFLIVDNKRFIHNYCTFSRYSRDSGPRFINRSNTLRFATNGCLSEKT